MSMELGQPGGLVFVTQGDELSYHARAAQKFMGDLPIEILPMESFSDVVRATRSELGIGVMAFSLYDGSAVEDAGLQLVCNRPIALSTIMGREDVEIELVLASPVKQPLKALGRKGMHCLGQKAALQQCEPFLNEHLPYTKRKRDYRKESIKGLREVLERNDPDWVAVAPRHAVEALGGVILGPKQINPEGSKTSFYILQQDPEEKILPEHPDRTEIRTVLTVAHPEGPGEFEKCMEVAARTDLDIARFIPFAIGDFTKHDKDVRRGGGVLEVKHKMYDKRVTEFAARVIGLADNNGIQGPFTVRRLGRYWWYPEPSINPFSIVPPESEVPARTVNPDRVFYDLNHMDARLHAAISVATRGSRRQLIEAARNIGAIADEADSRYSSIDSNQLKLPF